MHTNTSKSYAEAGMISLSEQRKLAISKYVIRSPAVINSVTEEFFLDSNEDYPKSAQSISSIQPIRNYINDLINERNIILNYSNSPYITSNATVGTHKCQI